MKTEDAKKRFIELKNAGFSSADISKILGIGERTAYRWSAECAADINMLNNRRQNEINKKLEARIDEYIDFLHQNFEIIKTELKSHTDIRVTYDKILQYSLRIFHSVKTPSSFKIAFGHQSDETDIQNIIGNMSDKIDEDSEQLPESAASVKENGSKSVN